MPSVQALKSVDEDEEILRMRCAGMTPSQIATHMGSQWTHRQVSRVLDKLSAEAVARRNATVDEMHMLSLLRLEQMHQWTVAKIEASICDGVYLGKPGDLSSLLSTNVKIMERISKMLGLDKVPAADNWLSAKTDAEMADMAAKLGIDVSSVGVTAALASAVL